MLNKDFYGKNSFVWWTGLVEDRDDPLQLGSVRVRIIGLHSDDKSLVPIESLPWAQVMHSPNGSNTTSGPREGDWVFGFFQDGDYAQIPVVMGVFPGIESVQSQTIYGTAIVKKGPTKTPVSSHVDRILGEPTTVRMSRGIPEGTLTERLNKDLSHACDVKAAIEASAAWSRLQNGQLIKTLVTAIKTFAGSLGADPSGIISTSISILQKIRSFLVFIQNILRELNDWAQVLVKAAAIARAVIDYITNLPARLVAFLRECLAKVVSGISAIIKSIFATSDIDFGVSELVTEFGKTFDELGKTGNALVTTVTLPAQIIGAAINPPNAEAQAGADKVISGVIGSVAYNGEYINNQTQFSKTKSIA